MKKIKATLRVTVDDDDYNVIPKSGWYVKRSGTGCLSIARSQRTGGKVRTVILGRLVASTPSGQQVHHKDGDFTNNRLSNLANMDARSHGKVTRGCEDIPF